MAGKSGYFEFTSTNGWFTAGVYWSETYSIESNTSIVQVDRLQIKSSEYTGIEYPGGYIRVEGRDIVSFNYAGHHFYLGGIGVWGNVEPGAGYPAAPWKSIAIPHDAEGKKRITMDVGLSGTGMGNWSVSGSTTIDLTDIPRASTPTLSIASPNVGDTINTNRKVSSYTHDITYSFGNASGTIGTDVGESVQWDIPMDLAKAITEKSGTLTLTTVTKSGGATIGTATTTHTLKIPDNDTTKPKITAVTLAPEHELDAKFSGVYVQGRSAIRVNVEASSEYSTIAKYETTVLGTTYEGNDVLTNILSVTGEVAVRVTVTDARGYSQSETHNVLYYPYSNPSVSPPDGQAQITCKRCKADGTLDVSGIHLKIEAGKKFSSVNGINQCELRYRYAVAGGSFSGWIPLLEKGSAANSIRTDPIAGVVDSAVTTYTIEIGVIDDVGTEKSVTFPIGTASAVWHAAEGGKALGIGGYAQQEGVDCFWDIHMNGHKIYDLYPVGSVYISFSNTSPEELFGGKWEQVTGSIVADAIAWRRIE